MPPPRLLGSEGHQEAAAGPPPHLHRGRPEGGGPQEPPLPLQPHLRRRAGRARPGGGRAQGLPRGGLHRAVRLPQVHSEGDPDQPWRHGRC